MLGLLMWQMFWDGLFSPQWIGRRLRGVLGEIAFPLEAVLIAGGCYAAFNATFYLLIILAGYFVVGVMPPASFVLGILAMPLVIAAGLSIGVYFVPLTFIYLDFRYALPLMQPALMWTAPILYETPASGALHWMNRLNPLTYLIAVPRDWFAEGWRLEEAAFPITIGISLVLLAVGLRFYHYSMPRALECLPTPVIRVGPAAAARAREQSVLRFAQCGAQVRDHAIFSGHAAIGCHISDKANGLRFATCRSS